MPYSTIGCHLPNGPMDPDRWADAFGAAPYTVLHMQVDGARRIRAKHPDALILVRMYTPDWYALDPVQWARACADTYRRTKDVTRHVTWANEQNLADESGGKIGASSARRATLLDYRRINAWNLLWLDEWRRQPGTSDAVLHYPAFASGHSDDQDDDGFVGLDACRPSIDLCPVLDRHVYWRSNAPVDHPFLGCGRVRLVEKLFPGKLLFCSEAGNFDVTHPDAPKQYVQAAAFFAARYPRWLGWTPFIADSPDRGHDANNLSRNPAIIDALRGMPKTRYPIPSTTPPPKEEPVPEHSVGPGVKAKMAEQKDKPLSDEVYFGSDVSFTFGEKGIYVYSKQANRTYFTKG